MKKAESRKIKFGDLLEAIPNLDRICVVDYRHSAKLYSGPNYDLGVQTDDAKRSKDVARLIELSDWNVVMVGASRDIADVFTLIYIVAT